MWLVHSNREGMGYFRNTYQLVATYDEALKVGVELAIGEFNPEFPYFTQEEYNELYRQTVHTFSDCGIYDNGDDEIIRIVAIRESVHILRETYMKSVFCLNCEGSVQFFSSRKKVVEYLNDTFSAEDFDTDKEQQEMIQSELESLREIELNTGEIEEF